jgi:hypothetical protein
MAPLLPQAKYASLLRFPFSQCVSFCLHDWLSQYYYIHLLHRLSLLGGLFTLILYYVSSLFHRTLIYPKKYLSHANKSLRQFNLKLVPNPVSSPLRNLPVLRWIFRPKPVLGQGGVKVVLNQRGGVEGEFIEGWEMFREDFWEEEERLRREEQERIKREGRRPNAPPPDTRPGSGRPKTASGTAGRKKKKASVSGSVSSVKTSSTGAGSLKEKGTKKKKKRTAEQAVAGLWTKSCFHLFVHIRYPVCKFYKVNGFIDTIAQGYIVFIELVLEWDKSLHIILQTLNVNSHVRQTDITEKLNEKQGRFAKGMMFLICISGVLFYNGDEGIFWERKLEHTKHALHRYQTIE